MYQTYQPQIQSHNYQPRQDVYHSNHYSTQYHQHSHQHPHQHVGYSTPEYRREFISVRPMMPG